MARDLRLNGWVRNRHDGAIEAVFQGAPDAVSQMLRLCEKGPSYADVTRVEIVGEGVGAYDGFEVRRTE
jgi:acylphosphatase